MTTYEILKSIEKEIDDLEFIDNIDLCPRDFLIGRIDVKKYFGNICRMKRERR